MYKLLTYSRVAALSGATENAVTLLDCYPALGNDTDFKMHTDHLAGLSSSFNIALCRTVEKSELIPKDDVRDAIFLSLYTLADALAHFSEKQPLIRKAGIKLLAIMDKYSRRMVKKSMVSETALIDSLLTDCQTELSEDELDAIGIVKIALQELSDAQEAFRTYSTTRSIKISVHVPSASELKKGLLDYFNKIYVPYVAARAFTSKGDFKLYYDALCKQIDGVNQIERLHHAAIIKKRDEAKKAGQSTDEKVNTTEPDAEITPGQGQGSGNNPSTDGSDDESKPMV